MNEEMSQLRNVIAAMLVVALLGVILVAVILPPWHHTARADQVAKDPKDIPWDGKSNWVSEGEVIWSKVGNQGVARFVLVASETISTPRTQGVDSQVKIVPLDARGIPHRAREITLAGPESDVEISATILLGGMSGQLAEDNVLVPPMCRYKGQTLRITVPEFDIGP